MRILGIDPGLLNLGCVLIEIQERDFEILSTETFKPNQDLKLSQKLFFLYQKLKEFMEKANPTYLVLEEVLPKAHPQTTVKLAQAQALVLLLAEKRGIPLKLYHPSYWKSYLCGNGQSGKKVILNTLKRLFPRKIDDKIKDEHQVSALSLALVFAMENHLLRL